MDISFVFLIAGIIILIGFLGSLLFERTKISDVLVLLGIGVLLGPILKLFDPKSLMHFAEYFGSLALMIILFEGGMDMDIHKLIKEFGTASLLVLLSFSLSTCALSFFLHFIYGWEIMRSILLGTILGCTSSAIVIPIVSRMTIKQEIQTILSIESALSDVLAVVLTVSLLEFIQLEHIGLRTPFRSIASSFSIAIVSGIVFGLFWLKILDFFKERKYSYMITLAAVLIVFALVKFLGGSGSIAVLIFGVILGNCQYFGRYLKLKSCILVNETIKFFHGEVTFFIRTFFFVYLGMMISFKFITLEIITISVSLVLTIVLVRYFSVIATGLLYHEKREDRFVMLSMIPRGLASAVLATLPVSVNVKGYTNFVNYTFAVIVLTNLLMTFGVFVTEKKKRLKVTV